MTTANTVPNHSNAVAGVRELPRENSIPATAAMAPAVAARSTPTLRWSMPKAAATVRSSAKARTARPANVRRRSRCAPPMTRIAMPNASSVGAGNTNRPMWTDSVAYGLTSAAIRWKSALQMLLTAWTMMMSRPKLSSSEFSSVMLEGVEGHCTSAAEHEHRRAP